MMDLIHFVFPDLEHERLDRPIQKAAIPEGFTFSRSLLSNHPPKPLSPRGCSLTDPDDAWFDSRQPQRTRSPTEVSRCSQATVPKQIKHRTCSGGEKLDLSLISRLRVTSESLPIWLRRLLDRGLLLLQSSASMFQATKK